MKIIHHAKKIIFAFLLSLVFFIPSVILSSCGGGGNNEVKVNALTSNESTITVKYRDNIASDPFGIKIEYSDGTKKAITDLSEEEAKEVSFSITKDGVPWDTSKMFTVGFYSIVYTYKGVSINLYMNVEKADYTGTVNNISTNNNSMVYGGALIKPQLTVTYDEVEEIQYFYQLATDDSSYRCDKEGDTNYGTYTYSETETCFLNPGDYQLYAIVSTKNYKDRRTPLKPIVVRKADVSNYGIFKRVDVFNNETQELVTNYEPYGTNNKIEIHYFKDGSEYLSDYVKLLNDLYVFEVDSDGNIKRLENGDLVSGQSFSYLFNADGEKITMTTTDYKVTQVGNQTFTIKYTPNDLYYNGMNFRVSINITKLQLNIYSTNLGIRGDDSIIHGGSIEFDGKQHTLDFDAIEDNGTYYGVYKYYKNQEDKALKVYTISNYKHSEVGTYTTVLNVINELKNVAELTWTDINPDTGEEFTNHGVTLNLGQWKITPKSYLASCDVTINNSSMEDYFLDSNFTLLVGKTYSYAISNIETYYGNELDNSPHATFSRMRLMRYNDLGQLVDLGSEYVSIDEVNNTVKINKFIENYSLCFVLEFITQNQNYEIQSMIHSVDIRYAYLFDSLKVKYTPDYSDTHGKLFYCELNGSESQYANFYVSLDEVNYLPWASAADDIYFGTDVDNLEKYIDSYPKYSSEKHYYLHQGSEYLPLKVYYTSVTMDDYEFTTSNQVSYDGLSKTLSDTQLNVKGFTVYTWSISYSRLYYAVYGDNEVNYVLNTSNVIDPQKNYYLKVGDNYTALYRYIQVGEGYTYVGSSNIIEDGVEYYLANFYCDYNSSGLEKYDTSTNTWVEVEYAREVGRYRTQLVYSASDFSVLVDSEGNFINKKYYEWEIVDNKKHIKVSDLTFKFIDDQGNLLPNDNNNHITINDPDLKPIIVTANVTFDTDVVYALQYQYKQINTTQVQYFNIDYGRVLLPETGDYVIKIYVYFEEDCLLVDDDGNYLPSLDFQCSVTYPEA